MIRKTKAILAVLSAVAILLTATFAFGDIISQRNVFTGTHDPTGDVTLHDDFDPGTGQKDVYVENTGEREMYVRIKLDEYMDLTSNKAPDSPAWVTHIAGQEEADCADCEHGMSGSDKLFHDYFDWNLGGSKYYMPHDGSDKVVQNTTKYDSSTPGAKLTPGSTVITSWEYLHIMTADEQKAFQGWIYSSDGFAYWSQPVKSGEATGLLLNGVTLSGELKKMDYYYAINVIVQASDKDDTDMWTKGSAPKEEGTVPQEKASDDGIDVINKILGNSGEEVTPPSGKLVVKDPADPNLGYKPDASDDEWDERARFASSDMMYTIEQQKPGFIYLEDILPTNNYANLTVTPVDSQYDGLFTIGTSRHGKPAIVFKVYPNRVDAEPQYLENMFTWYPITTQLVLEQNGLKETIKVTLLYDAIVLWD